MSDAAGSPAVAANRDFDVCRLRSSFCNALSMKPHSASDNSDGLKINQCSSCFVMASPHPCPDASSRKPLSPRGAYQLDASASACVPIAFHTSRSPVRSFIASREVAGLATPHFANPQTLGRNCSRKIRRPSDASNASVRPRFLIRGCRPTGQDRRGPFYAAYP